MKKKKVFSRAKRCAWVNPIECALELGKHRRGLTQKLWEMFAYAARYGSQPYKDLKEMTLPELVALTSEISKIIHEESTPRGM